MKSQKLATKSDTKKKSPALERKSAQKKSSDPLTYDYNPLENISCRIGDSACAAKHVSVIQRTGLFHPMNENQKVQSLLRLQQQYGNRFVQRVIAQDAIQGKLKISQSGDIYEQEADRVAEQVMNMPEPQVQQQAEKEEEELIQTKPIAGQITPLVQRQVEEEEKEEENENVKELKTKIKKLVKDKFSGDYKKAFNHYDENNDKGIDAKELKKLLKDADVGNWATRGAWVSGIMERLDTNKNGKIEWSEFKAVTEESEKQEKTVQPKLETNAESLIQRQAGEEEEEEEEEEEILQTKGHPNQTSEVTPNLESRIQSLKGDGQPLPYSIRSYFESRFGYDFSEVRVHTDSKAAETAKSINAKVFTTGKDVAFGAGQYSPETSTGKRLLAHELTHVVQQNAMRTEKKSSTNLMGNVELTRSPLSPVKFIQCSNGCPLGLEEEINYLREQIEVLPEASSPKRADLEAKLAWREAIATECLGLKPYTSTRHDVLAQLKIEAMLHRGRIADLSKDLASLEPVSSSTQSAWDTERDTQREALISILETRSKLLEAEITDLREYLMVFPSEESLEYILLLRYEAEWTAHQQELQPLHRWRARRRINAIDQEINEINAWLAKLPQVCSLDEPLVEELLSRKATLESEQQRLVSFLTGEMIEYEQWDPRWGAIRYGRNPHCTNIHQAGCGPTSLAIVLNYLFYEDPELAGSGGTLEIVTPPQTVRYAETHGRVCNSGTAGDTMVNNISTGWPGFEGRRVTLDEATNLLRRAYPIIFLCRRCTGQTRSGSPRYYRGHFMVLGSVDEAGETYFVLDPGSGESRDIETISRRELERHTSGFWWIHPR